MATPQIIKRERKRLNPHKGMIIDVPTWVGAHDYHRDQQKLHAVSMHRHGIATGLEVVAWDPPDNSVVIYPGIAVDPEGNTIVVPEPQRFYLNTEEKGTARIILRYSEIDQDMRTLPGEVKAHPLYILEGFRIEERREEPQEPHLELARVQIGGKGTAIKDAEDPAFPKPGEVDIRYRSISGPMPEGEIVIGVLAYPKGGPAAGWDCHRQGVFNLAQSVRNTTGYTVKLLETVGLDSAIRDCQLLFMSGHQEFSLSEPEEEVLVNYFNRGGILFAEACSGGEKGGAKGFRSSFAALCTKLKRDLRPLEPDHAVLHSYHIFGQLPPGPDGAAVVMKNHGVIYSDADYGCVWQGGRQDNPMARGAIRDALEFGVNVAIYSHLRARTQGLKLAGR
ncbi:MAG: hypothetical protein DRI40_03550 [Chloroflexi bacterium]|nr:MAG: hypothetical protein DRI40_03550 [Chloroflexota bacterium]